MTYPCEFTLISACRHYDYDQIGEPGNTEQGITAGSRGRYHYALHSLADLHGSLGHTQEALKCLSEAMEVAQQAGDHMCLSNCLASLQRLMVDAPGAPGLPEIGLGTGRQLSHYTTLQALLRRYVTPKKY